MLKLCWNSLFTGSDAHTSQTPAGSLLDSPDLRIRNLLDDPRLRRSMGLDLVVVASPVHAVAERPHPRFDRRRLLDEAAA